jgi:hypothetical protein
MIVGLMWHGKAKRLLAGLRKGHWSQIAALVVLESAFISQATRNLEFKLQFGGLQEPQA